jgi:ubiquinol-cytochrome c reductase cytochrome b subunit
MMILVMATAFLGYVLPWGQMSFWAATVITNFVSAIPYVGSDLVIWLWGGFAVGAPTLGRFYILHFLFPFIIAGATVLHLVLLHSSGRKSPVGVERYLDKVSFRPLFSFKDALGIVFVLWGLVAVCVYFPTVFMDVENFILANQLVTPTHIKPE